MRIARWAALASVVVLLCAPFVLGDKFTHKQTGQTFEGNLTGAQLGGLHKVVKSDGGIEYIKLEDYKIEKTGSSDTKEPTVTAGGFKPCLGVVFQQVDAPVALVGYTGKVVAADEVLSDSAGKEAGMLRGDIVLSVNGNPVRTEEGMNTHLRLNGPDKAAIVQVWRDGKQVALTVKADDASKTTLVFRTRVDGSIGLGFGRVFTKTLAEAASLGAKVIVVQIDSPGGLVYEATQASTELLKLKGVRTVAYVQCGQNRGALSAAALIAASCDEIYMESGTSIGAATPYKTDPKTGNALVDEKMVSAFAAQFRSVAEAKSHPKLVCEAMVDSSKTVWQAVPKDKGEMFFFECASFERAKQYAAEMTKGPGTLKLVSAPGKLLTLTSEEAVGCKLAKGPVKSLDEVCVAAKVVRPRPFDSVELVKENVQRQKVEDAFLAERRTYDQLGAKYEELGQMYDEAVVRVTRQVIDPRTGMPALVQTLVPDDAKRAKIKVELNKQAKAMVESLRRQIAILKPYPEMAPVIDYLIRVGTELKGGSD